MTTRHLLATTNVEIYISIYSNIYAVVNIFRQLYRVSYPFQFRSPRNLPTSTAACRFSCVPLRLIGDNAFFHQPVYFGFGKTDDFTENIPVVLAETRSRAT